MSFDPAAHSLLLQLRERVESGGAGAVYGDRDEALADIDAILEGADASRVRFLLLPTANLQELAIECGWGGEFNHLASELERILGI